jgi:tetratricopeptide (TPR) repeat protein
MEGEKVKTDWDREKVGELWIAASISFNARNLETARKLFLEILDQLQGHEGTGRKFHEFQIKVWFNLATTLRFQGQHKQALELYDLVLASPALDYLILPIHIFRNIALNRAECTLNLRHEVHHQDLAAFDKNLELLIYKGIKESIETDGYTIMARFRRKQNRFDLALPWAKKAADLCRRYFNSYNNVLMEYALCLVKTNDLTSALEIAQERVDFWIGSEKNAVKVSDALNSRRSCGEWLQCISHIHMYLGNKKLGLRYAELGTKEALTKIAEAKGATGIASLDDHLESVRNWTVTPRDLRICSNCFKTGNHDVMPKCSQCHSEFYCNVDCQKKRWPGHKNLCKKLVAEIK